MSTYYTEISFKDIICFYKFYSNINNVLQLLEYLIIDKNSALIKNFN